MSSTMAWDKQPLYRLQLTQSRHAAERKEKQVVCPPPEREKVGQREETKVGVHSLGYTEVKHMHNTAGGDEMACT